MGNLRLYLRKTRGEGGSGDVSPKGKRKELEVFTHGPLVESSSTSNGLLSFCYSSYVRMA